MAGLAQRPLQTSGPCSAHVFTGPFILDQVPTSRCTFSPCGRGVQSLPSHLLGRDPRPPRLPGCETAPPGSRWLQGPS